MAGTKKSRVSKSGKFDVVVRGGGPAGCITGMLLARRGCSVAIVDKERAGLFCIGETLPPQAMALLAELGLLDAFQAQGHRPSPGIVSVWGDAEPQANDFLFSPYGCGWHIDRAKWNAMLRDAARAAGAVFLGEAPEGRVVVDARGRSAPRRRVFDRLIAVAGLAPPADGSLSDFTLIEAVEEGWFYSALLPCGQYMLAFMTDADIFAANRSLPARLERAPHTRERVAAAPASLGVFSAATSIRETVARSNFLAVGDAARSYDPLSGLGLVTAMRMAMDGAAVVLDLLHGNSGPAAEYERANREAFAGYRETHRSYYGLERRWSGSAFWRRRTAPLAVAARFVAG